MCHLLALPTEGTANGDPTVYQPPAWAHLRLLIQALDIQSEDVFLDYGCGAGRILCEVCRQEVERAVGIEISQPLVTIAKRNLGQLKKRISPFEIFQGDAAEFVPTGCTIAFFFNPFGEDTMSAVLEKLTAESRRTGRDIQLIYLNPQCKAVFDERENITENRVLKWRAFSKATICYTMTSDSKNLS